MEARVADRGEHKRVPIAKIRPNGFNYNVQNEKTFTRLMESMRKFGYIEPVIVRQVKGGYEIINGEHRWRAAQMARMDEVPVINLGKMKDDDAKQLCIILNELGGKPDEVQLAKLLRDINVTVPVDDLLSVMPYSNNELDMYLKAMDFSFDNLPAQSVKTEAEEKEDMLRLKLGWEGDEAEKLIARLARIDEDPKKAVERCVEAYEVRATKAKKGGKK